VAVVGAGSADLVAAVVLVAVVAARAGSGGYI